MTTPKQYRFDGLVDEAGGWTFYRTPQPAAATQRLPVLRELAQMERTRARLDEVIDETRPDVLHAHSPVLKGIPALPPARPPGLPLVYGVGTKSGWEGRCGEGK